MSSKLTIRIEDMMFGTSGCVGLCSIPKADEKHPNKMPFSGTLLRLDEPSNKSPHGSEGHRIYISTEAAKKRLKTLVNTGLNYAPDLEGHAVRRKIGVITGAKIEGKDLKVFGFVWSKDFPEAKTDLKKSSLGMSVELSDVYVRSRDEDVWHLVDFQFSGATVLYKTNAAYYKTALAAAAAVLGNTSGGGRMKDEKDKKDKVAAAAEADKKDKGTLLASAIAAAVAPAVAAATEKAFEGLKGILETGFKSIVDAQAETNELILGNVDAKSSKSDDDDDDDDDEEDDEEAAAVKAAKKASKSDDDDDEDEDDEDDEDDDAELEAELEVLTKKPAEMEPGQMNKNAKNRGSKTTVTAAAEAPKLIRSLQASNELVLQNNKKLGKMVKRLMAGREEQANKIEALEAQVQLYAERTERKSLSPELANILAKGGHNVADLFAEGKKLSVAEVDNMFLAANLSLDPTTRMALKNQLLEHGLMEQGEVRRHV